jgi:large subunit ribosomal protein L20
MVRVKRGKNAYTRRRAILKLSAGFKGAHSRLFSISATQIMKSLMYSYTGRKKRKTTLKKLWISRLTRRKDTSSNPSGVTGSYSVIKKSFNSSHVSLNLKSLNQLLVLDPQAFTYLIEKRAKLNLSS